MEDDTVLREATSRRDAALAEARRLDDFIRLYNDLRGGGSAGSSSRGSSSSSTTETKAAETIGGDFILEKQRR